MSDERFEKLKRQNRRILIAIFILLLAILGIGFALIAQTNKNNTEFTLPPLSALKGPEGKEGMPGHTPVLGVDYYNGRDGAQGPQGIQGLQGVPGPQGVQGIQGVQGKPGAEGIPGRPPTSEETATAVASYCAANNNCQGEPGPPGRTPEIRCNEETGLFETRYKGDDIWTPMEGSDCNGPGN